jgi:hypothetical protein
LIKLRNRPFGNAFHFRTKNMKRSRDWAALTGTILQWWHGRPVTVKVAAPSKLSHYLAQLEKSRRRRSSPATGND